MTLASRLNAITELWRDYAGRKRWKRGNQSSSTHPAGDRPLAVAPAGAARSTLPHFLIIGAQKCGTTSLYHYLATHPRIASGVDKEIHYFDRYYDKGLSWYEAHFAAAKQAPNGATDLLCFEATPCYLFHPHAPRRVWEIMPQVKLIVVLRDPVDRALSHYHHERDRLGREPLLFEEALRQEEERLRGEWEKMLQDESYYSDRRDNYSYLARGIYVDQLLAWRRYFPAEQILALKAEDMDRDPAAACRQVTDFLGLAPLPTDYFPRFNSRSYSAMDRSTRLWLAEYFEPHNRRLYQLLGTDLGWEREASENDLNRPTLHRPRAAPPAFSLRSPFRLCRRVEPSWMVPDGKHGYYADLENVGIHAACEPRTLSLLVLLEDSRPLGPPHQTHEEVRDQGMGRYSHWNGTLFFSTSDNSDPRSNGRVYKIQVPVSARAYLRHVAFRLRQWLQKSRARLVS